MQTSRLKKYSKIIICLGGMILLSVGTMAYAQTATADDPLKFTETVQQIVTLLSRLWVVLAMGAGKLMGNTFVYGEFMNFDVYLRQMWNISKNFANMAIGLMFLFYVRKIVFTPDQLTGSEVGKKIWGFLLAGVFIQASRFMMGALLDIEKIATSAMGALPALVIQDDNSWWQTISLAMEESGVRWKSLHLKESGTNPTYLVYDGEQPAQWFDWSTEWILDAILPTHNSLSWPLYFIWFAIFKFQNYSKVPEYTNLTLKDLSWIFTAIGIKFLMLCAFVIMMLLLFIINIVRIAYLWMVIALAPIIILYIILKEVMWMDIWWSGDGIMSKINIKTILAYIFQPTIIITFMGLMLIAVTALWQETDPSVPTVISEYGITLYNTWVQHATFQLETKGDLFGNIWTESKGIFKNLIILWLVFALLLGLITLSASSLQIKFIENIATSLTKSLVKIPFMPVFSMWWAANKIFKDTTGISLTGQNAGKLDITWHNALNERFGDPKIGDEDDQKFIRSLNRNIRNPESYFDTIQQHITDKWDTWLLMSTQWLLPSLTQFIKENPNGFAFKNLRFDRLTPEEVKDFNLATYLKKDKNAIKLYTAMTGQTTNSTNATIANEIVNGRLKLVKPKTTETKKS